MFLLCRLPSGALPHLGKEWDGRGTAGSALGEVLVSLGPAGLVSWSWKGQHCPVTGTEGWEASHKLLSALVLGFGLFLPSCVGGGKGRVLGQADPARGGGDGLHSTPAVLQQGMAVPARRVRSWARKSAPSPSTQAPPAEVIPAQSPAVREVTRDSKQTFLGGETSV